MLPLIRAADILEALFFLVTGCLVVALLLPLLPWLSASPAAPPPSAIALLLVPLSSEMPIEVRLTAPSKELSNSSCQHDGVKYAINKEEILLIVGESPNLGRLGQLDGLLDALNQICWHTLSIIHTHIRTDKHTVQTYKTLHTYIHTFNCFTCATKIL